jgi:Beta-propeller repeat/NHL repeat
MSIAKDASGRIYVANEEGGASRNGSIAIYPAGSTGQVLPSAVISGVNTELNDPVGVALDSAGNIYVTNLFGGPTNNGIVTEYAAGSNGDVAPIATITSTGYAVGLPRGIALDSAGNIYVANFLGNNGSISVFAPGSNGNATPIASIAGSNTGIQGPYGLALDSSGNIYVSNHGGGEQDTPSSITVYAAGSNGNVAPTATIIGPDTLLDVPVAVALDSLGNIYAANSGGVIDGVAYDSGTITVYPPGSTGNVSPSAIIYGSNTELSSPGGILVDSSIYVANFGNDDLALYSLGANGNAAPTTSLGSPVTGLDGPVGIAVDANQKTYVANSFLSIGNPSGSVTIYPSGGYGVGGAPRATIIGANTGLLSPSGIALDTNGNIYVSNASGGSTGKGSVTVYAPTSNGNATPSATIVAANSYLGIFDPTGVAVDTSGNIYALAFGTLGSSIGDCIDVFPPGSNGTVTPSSVIIGGQTQLAQPSGMTLDSHGNIYVANKTNPPSITMYAAGSSGNVAPTSMISGSNTGLTSPVGIGVDSSGNIYVVNSANSGGGIAGSVTVYSAGSSGNIAPIQTISGGDTGLFAPMGLALGFISQ